MHLPTVVTFSASLIKFIALINEKVSDNKTKKQNKNKKSLHTKLVKHLTAFYSSCKNRGVTRGR